MRARRPGGRLPGVLRPFRKAPGGGCSDRGRGVSRGRGRLAASRRIAAFRADRAEDCTAQL